MDDRTNLARLVEPLNPESARLIRDPKTKVERLPTPFLVRGLIFRVTRFLPTKPVGFTVGYAQPNFTVMLPGNRPGFQELVLKAGARLDNNERRVAYAVTLLETTRRFDQYFAVIRRADEVKLVNAARPEEEARFKDLRDKYRTLIKLPETGDVGPWTMPIYALWLRDLWRFDVTLHPDGKSEIAETKLEENVPFAPIRAR